MPCWGVLNLTMPRSPHLLQEFDQEAQRVRGGSDDSAEGTVRGEIIWDWRVAEGCNELDLTVRAIW
jgi:hypothetical protein